jgi:hypothetical protein
MRRAVQNGDMKRQAIVEWYHILRVHYHWPLFQAVRFVLWLSR